MTYIEFFTEDAVDNICSCLVSMPERVILIGSNRKKLKKHAERYHRFFLDRGYDIEFLYKNTNKNHLDKIVELLSEIVEEYDDCVFDLSGGEELMLVAVGIVYHRYRDMDIQLQRINLRSNTLYDCDEGDRTIDIAHLLRLSVEENIRLMGGMVVYESEKHGATYRWDWTADFIDDIRSMWDICRRDVRAWNTQIGVLAAVEALDKQNEGSLSVNAEINSLDEYLRQLHAKYTVIPWILNALEEKGLIRLEDTDHALSLIYKNEQVKRCLTKSGQVLEMYITLSAILAEDKDGEPVYSDVRNGVYIDWDGELHTKQEGFDIENEIDVMMMHGAVPVFVSCKNGAVDIDELYKLHTVATRFGGKYAKKVLVTTALGGKHPAAEYLRLRAADMNIRLLENPQKLNDDDLESALASLWCN